MKPKIQFAKQDEDLLQELNMKVDSYFKTKNIDKKGNIAVYIKAVIMFILYTLVSIGIFMSSSLIELYACFLILGPLTVFLALNIGHEAAHNIFCMNKKINSLLVYVFDYLGASGQIWKYKHVHSHHPYTNIEAVDLELEQPDIVRIFPSSPRKSIHQFQQYYMPFLYSIYTIIWFFYRDFTDFYSLRKEIPKAESLKFSIVFYMGKLVFLCRLLFLPMILLPFAWYWVLLGFVLCHIAASATVTFALISTHVGEHSQFPRPDHEGKLAHSWIRHQFVTTSDFATESRVVTFLYGGFNHHLTHHLFPFVSHTHYPVLTSIIREISDKYKVAIYPQPTILKAMRSHFRLLKQRANNGQRTLEWMEM